MLVNFTREPYEQRLLRILAKAGYTPEDVLHLTVAQILQIDGITVPNIRTILFLQNKLKTEHKQPKKKGKVTHGEKHQ